MYVRGETADRLFGSARELRGPGGRPIPVPKPEHLIAMKVQAMRDSPERGLQDLVDIAYLLQLDGSTATKSVGTSFEPVWRSDGMSSLEGDSGGPLNLDRDVSTTARDVAALRELRREVPGWLSLTPAELEALVPPGALDRRPVTSPAARPFTLP